MRKFIIALGALLVVGLVVVFGLRSKPTPVSEPVSVEESTGSSGAVLNTPDFYTNGVGIGPDYVQFSRSGTIGSGANSASWLNTTGRTVYVDLTTVTTTGTASSTYNLYAYASSSAPSTTFDFVAPVSANRMHIGTFPLATSSAATTTSSIEKATAGKVISVPDKWRLNVLLTQNTTGCNGVVGVCETATSTARGFNLNWYFRAFFKP